MRDAAAAAAAAAAALETGPTRALQSVPDGYATDDYAALPHPFWGDGSGSAGSLLGSSVADVRLNPNSPISMELPAALSRRRPVEEGSILVRGCRGWVEVGVVCVCVCGWGGVGVGGGGGGGGGGAGGRETACRRVRRMLFTGFIVP